MLPSVADSTHTPWFPIAHNTLHLKQRELDRFKVENNAIGTP